MIQLIDLSHNHISLCHVPVSFVKEFLNAIEPYTDTEIIRRCICRGIHISLTYYDLTVFLRTETDTHIRMSAIGYNKFIRYIKNLRANSIIYASPNPYPE